MNIFISYRRADSQDMAGRIHDHLKTVTEIANVFIDVTGIAIGEDFEACTDNILMRSDVCLVLIGNNWHGPRESENPRIFDEGDFVHGEVRLALNSEVKVRPVLVNGATMLPASEMPEDLARLPGINAARINHVSFDQDIDSLVSVIIGDPNYRRARPFWSKAIRAGLRSLLGAAVGLICLFLYAVVFNAITGKSFDSTHGYQAGSALAIICATAGAFYPSWRRRKP